MKFDRIYAQQQFNSLMALLKMKIAFYMVVTTLLLSSTMNSFADDLPDGASLYAQQCHSCHGGDQQMGNRIAPPVIAVKNHYMSQYPDKDSFVEAIIKWVNQPSQDKTLMPGAIRKFGLMPALPYSSTDLEAIATFIYEESMAKPNWYDKHYEKEHGKQKSNKSQ